MTYKFECYAGECPNGTFLSNNLNKTCVETCESKNYNN